MSASGLSMILLSPSMLLNVLSNAHFLQFPAHAGLRRPGFSESILERSRRSSSSLLDVCLTPLILMRFFSAMVLTYR